MTDDVGCRPADVFHESSADRGIFGGGQWTEGTTCVGSQTPAIVEHGEGGQVLDQRLVPPDERTGMHEDDRVAMSTYLVRQLDVTELEAIHEPSPEPTEQCHTVAPADQLRLPTTARSESSCVRLGALA